MKHWLALAGLLLLGARAGAVQPGKVTLSDGQRLSGPVRFATDKLRLLRGKRPAVLIPIPAIAAIHVLPWRSRGCQVGAGPGKPPAEAPLLEFRCRIVLRNGGCLWGSLSTRFNIEQQGGKRRSFGLTRRQRGKPGQTGQDLLHVTELRFAAVPATLPCELALQLQGVEQVESVHVLGLESQHLRPLRPDQKGGGWSAGGLWPDRYDVLVVARNAVYLQLTGETPTMPADVLTYLRRRELGRLLAQDAGQGVKRRALHVAGRVRRCRVLVLEETRKDDKPAERRLSIYQMEHLRGEWTISFIVPLYRDTAGPRGLAARWIHLRNELAVELTEKQTAGKVLLASSEKR